MKSSAAISKEEYERRLSFARQEAGRVWGQKNTRHKVMDTDLAEAFAKILVVHMYKPHLGCATTRELLKEIEARLDMEWLLDRTNIHEERKEVGR
jgi:uncharacterized FAD-dependent dehydrogenase